MNRIKKKRIIYSVIAIIVVGITLVFIFTKGSFNKANSSEPDVLCDQVEEEVSEFGLPVDKYDVIEGEIKRGDLFSTLLSSKGVSQRVIHNISENCRDIFNMRDDIKVGRKYRFYMTKEEEAVADYFVYDKDANHYILFDLQDSLNARLFPKVIDRQIKYAEVEITTSLWVDVVNAGITPLLAGKLADVYAWSIDFFGLQRGDKFKAVFEEVSFEGRVLYIEDVYFSIFSHNGKEFEVYNFEQDEKGNRYWNEKGESMRKAFLKAPLNFTRISSGFSYARKHPITRIVRPHTGVDYAAPTGTPVMTIGDGVVTERGYKGAGGNTVKIRHNSVYTTAYLHLSKYASGLKVGDRVKQGDVIGYVGSTGSSTGPHLDFRVWKNGTPINPLTMESPSDEPIKDEKREAFELKKEYRIWQRDSILAWEHVAKKIDLLKDNQN